MASGLAVNAIVNVSGIGSAISFACVLAALCVMTRLEDVKEIEENKAMQELEEVKKELTSIKSRVDAVSMGAIKKSSQEPLKFKF